MPGRRVPEQLSRLEEVKAQDVRQTNSGQGTAVAQAVAATRLCSVGATALSAGGMLCRAVGAEMHY